MAIFRCYTDTAVAVIAGMGLAEQKHECVCSSSVFILWDGVRGILLHCKHVSSCRLNVSYVYVACSCVFFIDIYFICVVWRRQCQSDLILFLSLSLSVPVSVPGCWKPVTQRRQRVRRTLHFHCAQVLFCSTDFVSSLTTFPFAQYSRYIDLNADVEIPFVQRVVNKLNNLCFCVI